MSLDKRIQILEKQVQAIEDRNAHVEEDKAWEVSYSRSIILFLLTFVLFGLYLKLVNIEKPWLNSLVPALAFMLAPLSLPTFKKFWRKYIYKA